MNTKVIEVGQIANKAPRYVSVYELQCVSHYMHVLLHVSARRAMDLTTWILLKLKY